MEEMEIEQVKSWIAAPKTETSDEKTAYNTLTMTPPKETGMSDRSSEIDL